MSLSSCRIAAAVLATFCSISASSRAADTLFDPSLASVKSLRVSKAECDVVTHDGAAWLRVRPTGSAPAGVTFTPARGAWDLSAAAGIRVTLRNPNAAPVTVRITAATDDAKGLMNACRNAVELRPNETRDVIMGLTRRPEDPTYRAFDTFYMYYKDLNVADNTIDPAKVAKLSVDVSGNDVKQGVELSAVTASGTGVAAPVPFFPFIDEYGQYVHGDWPGKVHADGDFKTLREQEVAERAGWTKPEEWDQYGGWSQGPTLKATGYFYAAKHEGKWWLVDPDGHLFWSYGPTGVGFGGDVTPITDRANWFAALPPENDPTFGQFYKNGRGATYKYYANKPWRGYDVQRANLLRKYGPEYEKAVAEVSHDRLHSWGFNTIGNWSAPQVYGLHKTAYTVAINSPGTSMFKAPDGHSFQDVFDPAWEPGLYQTMERQRNTTAGDPWNLGYFVDNERCVGWRPRAAAVAENLLKTGPKQPGKLKFIESLTAKYTTIDALNTAWKTSYASWDALRDGKDAPVLKDNPIATNDCGDFGMVFVERYFSVCRAAVKSVAPNNMFLGSRFYGHTDPDVVKLATKYWDVISYNIYDNPPDGRVNQYAKIDAPMMSTEWGIESDPMQTPFRDAKRTALTPAERSAKMINYSQHAIRLPNLVGAHFFQYRDQPLSGRPDGEATLRGFINVADTPNFELVAANRAFAYHLYATRAAAK